MSAEEDPGTMPPNSGKPDPAEVDATQDQENSESESPGNRVWWFDNPRNLKLLFYGLILLILLLLLPKAYRTVKNWRAQGLVSSSWDAFAVADANRGAELLRQAQELSPGSPSVQRGIELYNARIGDAKSLQSLLTQMRSSSLENGELLGIAEIEAGAGRTREAAEALSLLPVKLGERETLRRTLVESTLLASRGNIAQAASLCFSRAASVGKAHAGFLKIQGALDLLALHQEAATRRAREVLQTVAKEGTPASLSAWRIEARLILSTSPGWNGSEAVFSPQEIEALIRLLPTLPNALIEDQLLAVELELRADPSRQEALIQSLTGRYQQSDRATMLTVARWLNARGLHAEAIRFCGDERPQGDTDWLLIVLDAKSAMGKWSEIAPMLNSPAGMGIPDAVRYLFLARSASMRGDQAAADDAWSSVTASLPLEKPETLAYIAGYEEQIGAPRRAAQTYREMARRETSRRAGLTALIRIQPPSTPAATLIPLYEELLATAPDFTDAAGDLDYLKLLIGEGVTEAASDAEKRLKAQPDSLARISTAALGRMKQGDITGAMALYERKSIDWAAAPAPWRVVRSALLRAAGDDPGAERMAASIDRSKLRPEEIMLLNLGKKVTAIPQGHKD